MLNTVYIGIGQCGNRFVDCFAKGISENKRKDNVAGTAVLAINTAKRDMSVLKNIPESNRVTITLDGYPEGAGRKPEVGRESMEANLDRIDKSIKDACERAHMGNVDLCFLWAGLGGGTGTGGLQVLAEHLVKEGYNIAIGVTLPRKDEGLFARGNAYNAMLDLQEWAVEIPYVVIDNDKITDVTLEKSNEFITSSFSRLNKATSFDIVGNNFDNHDFLNVLHNDGTMAFVKASVPASSIQKGDKTDVLLNALREELKGSPFAGKALDMTEAGGAAIVVTATEKFLAGSESRKSLDENIRAVRSQLSDSNPNSAIYVHPDETEDRVFVYLLLTGLAVPDEKLDEMDEELNALIAKKQAFMVKNRHALQNMKKHSLSFSFDAMPQPAKAAVQTTAKESAPARRKKKVLDSKFDF